MTNYDVHSTLFFKYLRVNRPVLLLFLTVIFMHFLLLFFFPAERKAVTDIIWILSESLKILLSFIAFRISRDSVKKAWLFIVIYGLLTLSAIFIRAYYDMVLNVHTGAVLPVYLFAAGNAALVIAFLIFSHSEESVFKVKRQMNLIGLIFITILIISFLVNYDAVSAEIFAWSSVRTAVFGVVNISAFIIGLGIYWTGIWKKDFKRKSIFSVILLSTFISFVLNNLFFAKRIISNESIIGGFPDLLGTSAILLIGIAAWNEIKYNEEFQEEESYSLFYVSRMERIIPVLTLITLLAVLYFNLSKLDANMIKVLIIMMIPYIVFLLFFELYSYRSEDALLSILSVSPTGIHITDRKFTKTFFINKSLFDMFRSSEIPPDLIIGNGIKGEEKNRIIESVASMRSLDNLEIILKRPDGTKFNAQCRIIPAKYYSYDIVISWIWDITERKKYEGAILKQKYSAEIASLYKSEMLNNLSNRIQSGYVTMKPDDNGWPDFTLTGMNKRILELFSFKDDLTGEKLRRIFPDAEPGLIARFFEVLNTGVSVKRELYFKDIDKIFLFLIFRASEDEVACLIDDITESKRKEKELVEREREISTLLGNLPGMAYRCINDRNWTMLFVSQGSQELSGYNPEELIGSAGICWNNIIHPDDRDRVWVEVQESLDAGQSFHLDFRIISADMKIKHVWEKGLGVYDDDNNLLFIEGFILDITKQKEAEAVLREHELKENEIEKARALGQMAGGIAHDLNNRLMGIGSYTSLIDMKVKEINIKKYTEGIQESIVKSTELIENLLIFARQSDITSDIFSLQNMIREISFKALEDFPDNIRLSRSLDAAEDNVKGDYKQLYKAVYDIVLNAKDAMPDGGEIIITTENKTIDNSLLSDLTRGETDRLFILIKISDTGHGIDKGNLGRIFDPFYTTKPVGKGKGLGLSAVYGTIQAHKGAITVDSTPGKGTSFSIYLPVIQD
jgi:PAS domain S-box-containing protein